MAEAKTFNGLAAAVPAIAGSWYYDRNHFRRELQTIWSNNWLYVCAQSALQKPLSYRTMAVGRQSIVVLRDKHGELQAFHNTCRHRGSMLCDQESGSLKSNRLVCPYHQWSFSASSGALQGITSFTQPDNFNKQDFPLFRVALKSWHGLIFIHLNPQAQWHKERVWQYYDPVLDDFPIATMALGHCWKKVVKCNWKMYWENYSECLHCPNIHPELVELVPLFSRRLNSIEDVPGWQNKASSDDPKYSGGLRKGAQTWSTNGSAQNHLIHGLDAHRSFKGQSYSSTWPSMFLGAYGDHIRTVRILPLDGETMELTVEWLFEPQALQDPDYCVANVTDFATLVMEQDSQAAELNQRGVYSARFDAGVLMPEEYIIRDFHNWLRVELGERSTASDGSKTAPWASPTPPKTKSDKP